MDPYKRARPLLGTFFHLELFEIGSASRALVDSVCSLAFDRAQELENVFSKFSENSILQKFNRASVGETLEVPTDFSLALSRSEQLWRLSRGGFSPFFEKTDLSETPSWEISSSTSVAKKDGRKIDLTGLVKGSIIDAVVDHLTRDLPSASGVVNVGGDLRFFKAPASMNLKLGAWNKPILRKFESALPAVAVSSFSRSLKDPRSTTRYFRKMPDHLTSEHTVVATANEAWLADGLTKIVLQSSVDEAQMALREMKGLAFLFDPAGNLIQTLGEL